MKTFIITISFVLMVLCFLISEIFKFVIAIKDYKQLMNLIDNAKDLKDLNWCQEYIIRYRYVKDYNYYYNLFLNDILDKYDYKVWLLTESYWE